jgi:hypothetical protein
MIGRIIKLLIAALIANASWRIGSAYVSFYRFKDAVTETAQFSASKTVDELRDRVLELASQYDVPVNESNFTLRRVGIRTSITGEYTKIIEVVPGYRYPWPFSWNVETMNMSGLKLQLLILK